MLQQKNSFIVYNYFFMLTYVFSDCYRSGSNIFYNLFVF